MAKTFVFSTFGARGDVYPYLAIARELQSRGHRAIIATSEKYRAEIEARGLEFRAVRPDAPSEADARRMMHPVTGTEVLFRHLLLPAVHDSVADLRAAVADADVLVTHTTSLAGPMVAELEARRGLKWASAMVSPLAMLEEDVALPALPWCADYPVVNRAILFLLWRQLGMKLRETQEIRAKMGISRGDNVIWSDGHSPLLQLCLWDDRFAPVPENGVRKTVGFCTLEEEAGDMGETESFLLTGEAPLLFVAASFAHSQRWERESIQAAKLLGKRAILLGAESAGLEDGILKSRFLPLGTVVPHVAAMIHFGGIGTLALGLRAGTPMLLTPSAHDQPDNARRARRLGVARVLVPRNYRVSRLAREIGRLLGDRQLPHRLNSWRENFENGAAHASDALEQI
jgi:rhamnosyltransferase subunit B